MSDEDELTAMVESWHSDPINRALHSLWCSAIDSQAQDYVDAEGNIGPISEDAYIRKQTRSMREAREELDRIYHIAASGIEPGEIK